MMISAPSGMLSVGGVGMTAKTAIPLPLDKLADFCRRHGITRLEVFGSILRAADFGPKSDIDFMITLCPEVDGSASLMDVVDWQIELEKLLKRKVDLVERR